MNNDSSWYRYYEEFSDDNLKYTKGKSDKETWENRIEAYKNKLRSGADKLTGNNRGYPSSRVLKFDENGKFIPEDGLSLDYLGHYGDYVNKLYVDDRTDYLADLLEDMQKITTTALDNLNERLLNVKGDSMGGDRIILEELLSSYEM